MASALDMVECERCGRVACSCGPIGGRIVLSADDPELEKLVRDLVDDLVDVDFDLETAVTEPAAPSSPWQPRVVVNRQAQLAELDNLSFQTERVLDRAARELRSAIGGLAHPAERAAFASKRTLIHELLGELIELARRAYP